MYDVLQDQEYRSKWDKYFLETKDIGHLNPNNTLSYYASKKLLFIRGAIGGKTGKTAVLPGFCKIERGGGNGTAVL